MLELLRDVRALLEMEMSATGPRLPLDAPTSPSPPIPFPQQTRALAQTDKPSMPDLPSAGGDGAAVSDPLLSLIPADSPVLACSCLEELEQFVATNRLIPLDHTRTNPVFGVGNPNADLMVIGEAPGADEDLKGEPFVGRAGQLLDKILEATGFSRQTVYIANILKSRPPNNRDPQPDEVAAHAPILYRQIMLIRPRIILTVGRISACTLLGRTASLASLRGKLHDFHGIPLVVTYHPAALLRNPEWKRPTWEDMKFLRKHFDGLAAGA